MKLKIREFEELSKRKGYKPEVLIKKLGAGKLAYQKLKKGNGIGYQLVRELYNTFGEEELVKIIDFEEETLNGFKHKFFQVGTQLY